MSDYDSKRCDIRMTLTAKTPLCSPDKHLEYVVDVYIKGRRKKEQVTTDAECLLRHLKNILHMMTNDDGNHDLIPARLHCLPTVILSVSSLVSTPNTYYSMYYYTTIGLIQNVIGPLNYKFKNVTPLQEELSNGAAKNRDPMCARCLATSFYDDDGGHRCA